MRVQDYIADQTLKAVEDLFRNASHVPMDKLTWAPEGARSTLEQLQECAQMATFTYSAITDEVSPDVSPRTMVAQRKLREEWTTVGECERVCEFSTKKLVEAIRAMPDEKLDRTIVLPWGEVTYLRVAEIHAWNCNWHNSQIAFIQLLLGDKNMH